MKFGIIREGKVPPDKRAVFSPKMLREFADKYPQAEIVVQPSEIRIFKDEEYKAMGFELTEDMGSCDVLIGVKEVPLDMLIPEKKYFFFSHTIKKQPHNRKLLQAIIDMDIELFDHETIVDSDNKRLIGFGRYAGNVGAYNGFRAFGEKFDLFNLPKAETLSDKDALVSRLKRLVLPPVKIVLTGKGKVGMGAKEILDEVKIKQVSIEDFLTKSYDVPVYAQIDVLDYNKRKDGQRRDNMDFYNNPLEYVSDFERFTKVADIFMAGHFYGNNAPEILTQEMLKSKDNKVKVVADISCDVEGPVACTVRSSTIAEPFYGYHPSEGKEIDMHHPSAIVVMAVDNLPCELPKDATEGFGEMFLKHVIPAFYNNDKDGILQRARITEKGHLSDRFSYLEGYVEQKESMPH